MKLLILYGLFCVKTVTVIFIIVICFILIMNIFQRNKIPDEELSLTSLSDNYQKMKEQMQLVKMNPYEQKRWLKQKKKEEKRKNKDYKQNNSSPAIPTLYVIDFTGDIYASQVNSLRKEISAILAVANTGDEVVLRLESSGGIVHGYGLASSQLQRIRNAGLRLTTTVDKIAASGGYMMACVADSIVAAPFAIIGSIGVVSQFPNFHRLLKRNNIDIELHTAGQYKRTLTLFGKNTPDDRKKFREDLCEIHKLFKSFVHEMRPTLDIDRVANGDHCYGKQALSEGLIDVIATSDEFIINSMKNFNVIKVQYVPPKKTLFQRISHSMNIFMEHFF
ncbi:protease SohB [Candidatus Ishikawella capsulata]|uniref:Predicted inner membrane peptidase n=1 Tax=Candidatus Ishikawaella capsulata Mpkobe TaxID=476281 RepID=C5WCA0_9ENTR|nr:protease SohB [Candidatus Ishikawaella capsulata]BAH82956.1 predicted inner membrane peptidase [Candidatus Ishikawaella capsulata Mpkobe]